MSAPVLLEQPETVTSIRHAAAATKTVATSKNDYEALMIVAIAIVIAFTFTVCVIGTILIMLALRGSGVMAVLSIGRPPLG